MIELSTYNYVSNLKFYTMVAVHESWGWDGVMPCWLNVDLNFTRIIVFGTHSVWRKFNVFCVVDFFCGLALHAHSLRKNKQFWLRNSVTLHFAAIMVTGLLALLCWYFVSDNRKKNHTVYLTNASGVYFHGIGPLIRVITCFHRKLLNIQSLQIMHTCT